MRFDRGNTELESRAFEVMRAAERLSRRDHATQLWLIEHHLRAGRADQALAHFDIAFRTSASSRGVLFPLLANSLADDQMFGAVVGYLRRDPVWTRPFISFVTDYNIDPEKSTYLVREFLDSADPDDRKVMKWQLQRLTQIGQHERAWGLYAYLEPERARKHAQFARMVSLCGDRFVLASGGLERVPKSHNEFVPSESVTSLYDSTGALLARREARPLREEGVRRPYSHTQVTRDFVLEFRPDSDVLEVYRIPAASGD